MIAGLVADALDDTDPLPPGEATLLALGAVGDAIAVYHASVDLGDVGRARGVVRGHVALALGHALRALDFKHA